MKTVCRLMFIVCVAVFFSSNTFARDTNFYIQNKTRWPIDVSVSGNNYCVYSAGPSKKTVMPGSNDLFNVSYEAKFFSKCSSHHSSQDFNITIKLANNKKYSTTLVWYKPFASRAELRMPTIPESEHIKAEAHGAAYEHMYVPIMIFREVDSLPNET